VYVPDLRDCVRHRIDRRLPLVTAPTLVLRGQHDQIVPPGWAAAAARLAPGGVAGEITGAAHDAVTTAGSSVAGRAVLSTA
jgi:pimeloyl-ACP methyl ester carboxylesterase